MKSSSLTRLTDGFNLPLKHTRNELDDEDYRSDELNSLVSTVKSLPDFDEKPVRLHAT